MGFLGVGFIVLSVLTFVERMVALESFGLVRFVVAAFVIVDLGILFFGVRILRAGHRSGDGLFALVGLPSIRLELDPLSCRAVTFSIRPLPVVLVPPGRSVQGRGALQAQQGNEGEYLEQCKGTPTPAAHPCLGPHQSSQSSPIHHLDPHPVLRGHSLAKTYADWSVCHEI